MRLDGTSEKGMWSTERKNVSAAFAELMDLMSANVGTLTTDALNRDRFSLQKVQKMWKSSQVYIGFAKDALRKKSGQQSQKQS